MKRWIQACLAAWVLSITAGAHAEVFTPKAGDRVEVREGDVWSPAELVRQEGRRYQIRYEDGTEEWVAKDRIQPLGGGGAADAQKQNTRQAPPRRFRRGQKQVEFKDHNRWYEADIKRVSEPLYLVARTDRFTSQMFWEWMDADRLRVVGEDHDGPDVFSQFGEKLRNRSINDALREAKKKYQAHRREQEAEGDDDTPGGSSRRPARYDPFAAPPFDHPTSNPDRGTLVEVDVQIGGWDQAAVDPAPQRSRRETKVNLRSGKNRFFESVKALSVNGAFGLVAIEDGRPGEDTVLYAERFDLQRGKSLASVEFDSASLPKAISGDGKRIAGVSNGFHLGTKTRLDIWDWPAAEPEHVYSFYPFGKNRDAGSDIAKVLFVDPDTVVAYSAGGAISVWDLAQKKGLWQAQGLGASMWGGKLAISPGRGVLAVEADGHILLLDAKTGTQRATLPAPGFRLRSLSFSADGKTLVAGGVDRLKGYDLEKREAWPSIALRPGSGHCLALDGGRALGGGWVLDLATGQALHAFTHEGKATRELTAMQAGQFIAVGKDASKPRDAGPAHTLHAWSLTQKMPPKAQQARPQASPSLLLQRGDTAWIDLSKLQVPADERAELQAAIQAQLQDRGVTVQRNAPVTIVAATTTKSQKQTYESRDARRPFSREQTSVNVKTQTTRIAIEVEGQAAWAWSTTSTPRSMVSRKEGQSIQDAVTASGKHSIKGFFTENILPETIPDPRQAPGQSTTLRRR